MVKVTSTGLCVPQFTGPVPPVLGAATSLVSEFFSSPHTQSGPRSLACSRFPSRV